MKTLVRVLIILATFAIVMGAAYTVVNAGGTSSQTTQTFETRHGFAPDGTRPEFRSEEGVGGVGWIFGMIKNIGIVTVIVALITLPKSFAQKKRQAVSAANQ